MKVEEFLTSAGAHFTVHEHPVTYSSQQLAQAEHVSGRVVAKPVVVHVDHSAVLCVLPANAMIDLDRLAEALHAQHCRLFDEDDLPLIFPDVEVGAEPPFGKPYGLRTIVDEHLADSDTITFNAGSHMRAVQMPYAEYERLAEAEVLDFCARA